MKVRIRSSLLVVLATALWTGPANAQFPTSPGLAFPAAQPGMAMAVQPMLPQPMLAQPVFAPPMLAQPALGIAPANYHIAEFADAAQGGNGAGKGCGNHCGRCAECCSDDPITGGYRCGWYSYGEFLYLRARDAEVAYAVPFLFGAAQIAQQGPVRVLDGDFQPGYRFGVGKNLSESSRLQVTYTNYESSGTDGVNVTAPTAVFGIAQHPAVTNAQLVGYLTAAGMYDINFDLVDVEATRLTNYCDGWQVGVTAGVRYAQQEQQLTANFLGGVVNNNISTDIDFNGVGVKLGLDGEVQFTDRWLLYGKGSGSLLPGEFRASYVEDPNFAGAPDITTSWRAGRLVTIWELELGTSWVSCCQNYRANVGYLFSAWTNTVQTDEWINGVHANNFIDMDSTMTFDGLVARFEARF